MALKRAVSLTAVVARYGVVLRPSGQALLGRCPFHDDQGRPNLYVYPERGHWRCYRCGSGGDVISFVERMEGLGFPAAVARLTGRYPPLVAGPGAPAPAPPARRTAPDAASAMPGPAELACLEVATALYQRQLLATPPALRYLARRGLAPVILRLCRVGFAQGATLLAALRQHGLAADAARTCGLLRADGREALAGRIVVPELQHGQPVWLIGRLLDPSPHRCKYLGLPGPKPLLGEHEAGAVAVAVLTEGVFDWLLLRQWGYPALALLGTHASARTLQTLRRWTRLFLALDRDPPGQEATASLLRALGRRAAPVTLPPGVLDVADLGQRPDGRARFAAALARVDQAAAA